MRYWIFISFSNFKAALAIFQEISISKSGEVDLLHATLDKLKFSVKDISRLIKSTGKISFTENFIFCAVSLDYKRILSKEIFTNIMLNRTKILDNLTWHHYLRNYNKNIKNHNKVQKRRVLLKNIQQYEVDITIFEKLDFKNTSFQYIKTHASSF